MVANRTKQTWFVRAHQAWSSGNKTRAFRIFLSGAKHRDASCQQNLGYFYDEGVGIRPNLAKAIYWYERSARAGSSSAAYNLGVLYGQRRHYVLAKKWFKRALQLGERDAESQLRKLERGISPSAAKRLQAKRPLRDR